MVNDDNRVIFHPIISRVFSPKVYQPCQLQLLQWVKTAIAAGIAPHTTEDERTDNGFFTHEPIIA